MSQTATIEDRVDGTDLSVHVDGCVVTLDNVTELVCSGQIDLGTLGDRELGTLLKLGEGPDQTHPDRPRHARPRPRANRTLERATPVPTAQPLERTRLPHVA